MQWKAVQRLVNVAVPGPEKAAVYILGRNPAVELEPKAVVEVKGNGGVVRGVVAEMKVVVLMEVAVGCSGSRPVWVPGT